MPLGVAPVRKATILVVEDDNDLRNLYRTGLTGAGYAVVAVEDGLDALRRIELEPLPNAVVLDLALPRLSGRDVRQELQANPAAAALPIIVVTGGETSDLTLRDFDCVLRKLVTMDALIEAVENCLRRR